MTEKKQTPEEEAGTAKPEDQPGSEDDLDTGLEDGSGGEDEAEEPSEEEVAAFEKGFSKVDGIGDTSSAPKKGADDEKPKADDDDKAKTGEDDKAKKPDDDAGKDADDKKTGGEKAKTDDKEGKPDKDAGGKQPEISPEMQRRVRKLEGKIGELTSKLETALSTAASSKKQPTDEQIKDAMKNEDSLESFADEFPDFKVLVDKINDVNSKVSKTEQISPGQVQDMVSDAVERTKLETKHEDWEDVTQSPDFIKYALDGGPKPDDYKEINDIEDPAKFKQALDELKEDFPDWWKEKGEAIFSTRAKDAMKLLDGYKKHSQDVTKQEEIEKRRRKNQDRLEGAVIPEGAGGSENQKGLSDEEAFERSFNKTMKNRLA